MTEVPRAVPILTYHSISDAAGPTSIPAGVFREQMRAIADAGWSVISLDDALAWRRGQKTLAANAVAITFDDGFRDFAEAAHPVLAERGFPSCVFVPTAIIGGVESWRGANGQPRALMDWSDIAGLAREGVMFGSHTRTHPDLTSLSAEAMTVEVADSRKELEDRLGGKARFFAPPYGRSNAAVRVEIAKQYDLSVGVRLASAERSSPMFDMPRIEMHYYRDFRRWRAFLDGTGGLYFQARRAARALRAAVS